MAKRVKYQDSLITYLDILGFRNLVNEKTPGEISRILRLVKENVEPGKKLAEILPFDVQHFSDLAVRVLPIVPRLGRSGDAFGEILNLVYVQTSLINEGIFVRGGITFGSIVRSWRLLYGPGLIQAYDLETGGTISSNYH